MMKRSFLLFLLAALAFGCQEVKDPFQLPEYNDAPYYPLEIGRFWEYQVDSTIYDPIEPVYFSSTQVREEVVDTFLDLQNHPWYRIERFERASDTLPWEIKQVVAATIRGNEALRLEDDLTFVKLHFPLTPFKSWNGNKYFDPSTVIFISSEPLEMFKSWDYRVLATGAPDMGYSDVIAIQQAGSENLLERRYSLEKYARDTGLIFRELEILDDTSTLDENIPWEQKAERGFKLKQTLLKIN
jgi:hypothetical protein